MAFSTLISYTAGLGFLTYHSPRARKLCLVVPITVDLLLLGFFKYANFAMSSVRDVIHWFGVDIHVPVWDIILPVGISFYTFHTITYIVDSYRGTIKPTRDPWEFAAYVSLFSQLVAGPIVRFRQIEQDLDALGSADRTRWLPFGVSFLILGLVEKVLVADTLASFVDPALKEYHALSTLGTWLAVLGYSFQLYFDFCGYSDMAIGLGYLFGLRIPINFNSPYKALDPSDFWRRWHISLSTCLRDYLYIPLGGNRHGTAMMYRNLILTMLIGGLWHGANWTFVLWGGYHGLLLILHRLFGKPWDRLPAMVRQLLFFLLVVIGWVLFRATDLPMALMLLRAMFVPISRVTGADVGLLVPVLLLAAWWAMRGPNAQEINADYEWQPWHTRVQAVAFGACLAVMAGGRNSPFHYFQF
jgi:alginate O-acetyltransferase complex protein AlgI